VLAPTLVHLHTYEWTHLKLNMPAALLLYNSITYLHGEKATPPPKRFNPLYSFFQKTQQAILHSTPLCSLGALHLFMQCGGGNILNSSGLNDTRRSEWGKISFYMLRQLARLSVWLRRYIFYELIPEGNPVW
jgi:hypothetical protein